MNFSKEHIKEFIRFCIVGVVATGVHYGVYWLFNLWMNYNFAYTIGFVISLAVNFILSSRFTFKEQMSVKKGGGFLLAHFINWLMHLSFLNLFVLLGVSEKWAPIPVFVVVIPINFVLVRTVFKKLK